MSNRRPSLIEAIPKVHRRKRIHYGLRKKRIFKGTLFQITMVARPLSSQALYYSKRPPKVRQRLLHRPLLSDPLNTQRTSDAHRFHDARAAIRLHPIFTIIT